MYSVSMSIKQIKFIQLEWFSKISYKIEFEQFVT